MKKQVKLSANEFVILAHTYGYSTKKEAAQKYVEAHPSQWCSSAKYRVMRGQRTI